MASPCFHGVQKELCGEHSHKVNQAPSGLAGVLAMAQWLLSKYIRMKNMDVYMYVNILRRFTDSVNQDSCLN